MKVYTVLAIGITSFLVVIGLAMEGVSASEDERLMLLDYCQQVETFTHTDGEYGWPDYKGVYQTECN